MTAAHYYFSNIIAKPDAIATHAAKVLLVVRGLTVALPGSIVSVRASRAFFAHY